MKVIDEEDRRKVKGFLKEYYALCKKYGLVIDACGCCNSPWIRQPLFDEEGIRENVEHLAEEAGLSERDVKEVLEDAESGKVMKNE